MTRRMQHYDVPEWRPWLLVAAAGAALIAIGIALLIAQLVVSIRRREARRDTTGDPWDGRTLEGATASPPPVYNFARLPEVSGDDAYWTTKQSAREAPPPSYGPVEVPRNTATGIVCAFFATVVGFAMIWHIWWMAIAGFFGAWATFVVFAWRDQADDILGAAEVERIDHDARASPA